MTMGNQKHATELVSKKAVAAMLDCSVRQIDYLRANEGLPHVLVGSLVKFNPRRIEQWLESREISSDLPPTEMQMQR